jgi:hypothetical protein
MTAKVTKVSDKIFRMGENFTINIYDNGFMVDASGKDSKDDWTNAKIMVSSVDELVALVREIVEIERE